MEKRRHIITKKQTDYLKSKATFMKDLIDEIGEIESYYIVDPFSALCNSIIYQSISFKAATAIWNRFTDLVPLLNPSTLLGFSFDEVKDVGLSKSKTEYLFNIAEAFAEKSIRLDFNEMSNKEIEEELRSIKGIGPWTAEMFLIFCMNRPNVLSYGDIAIRRGLEFLLDLSNDITRDEFKKYTDMFSPYNTTASLYIWELTLRDKMKKK